MGFIVALRSDGVVTHDNSNRAALIMSAGALVIAVAGVGGPVVAKAFDAQNADKVDGKHAVTSSASAAQRKGKLVATSPDNGRLPNNIIRKAKDADKLDGLDGPAVMFPSAVPAGQLLIGWASADVNGSGVGDWGAAVSFGARMPDALEGAVGPSEHCPGSVAAPDADPGFLCFYLDDASGVGTGPFVTANSYGGMVRFADDVTGGDLFFSGSWAARAPLS